jgi:hypothetical protein
MIRLTDPNRVPTWLRLPLLVGFFSLLTWILYAVGLPLLLAAVIAAAVAGFSPLARGSRP